MTRATLQTQEKEIKDLITYVVTELVGDDGLPIARYLFGKQNISEFIIAEELDEEIHRTRNILYRLLENNIVYFNRKKDKIKGWYICYWQLNQEILPFLRQKIKREQVKRVRKRLFREENNQFFMCRNACVRMSFDRATEFKYKCVECGELMQQQDNSKTIEFLKNKHEQLETELEYEAATVIFKSTPEVPKEEITEKKVVKKKVTKKTQAKKVKKKVTKKKQTKQTKKTTKKKKSTSSFVKKVKRMIKRK